MKKAIIYYSKKGYTVTQIAERLKVSRTTVHTKAQSIFIQLNIEESRVIAWGRIIKKLVKRGYRDKEISSLLKISRNYVNEVRNIIGIKYPEINLTNKEKSLIVGTLLGDAYIRTEGETSRLELHHSTKQVEYCNWKCSMLPSLLFQTRYSNCYSKKYQKTYYSYKATSPRLSCLNEFGYTIKGINSDWLKYYNELSLAVHFMDDGMKTGNSFKLCTHSFNKEDLKSFVKYCSDKFGIVWTITKENSLYLPTKYALKFRSIVKPFIHPTLMYKID